MPNLRPILEGFDTALLLNNSIAASDLFSATDPDEGDLITQYRFTDNSSAGISGFFVFQGVIQANGVTLLIDADDLDELFYVAGPSVNNETITIEASDGELFSLPELVRLYSARQESVRPVAQVTAITVLGNESVLASSFISASDPDGYPIATYTIRDRAVDQSFFSLDGTAIAQGVFRTYTADEFSRLLYFAEGRDQENIDVTAFDGTVDSETATGVVDVRANLNRPVVDFASAMSVQDELFPIADVISFSDADGSTIKTIELRDRNDKSFSGSLVFRGQVLAPQQFHSFTLEEIDEVFFVGGERNTTEQIRYFASDGRFRSTRNTLSFDNVATGGGDGGPGAGVPRLIADNLVGSVREQLFFVSLNDLVRQPDGDFPAISYEVIDTNTSVVSARLFLDGQSLASGVVHTFTDDVYENQLQIRTGTFEGRFFDQIFVRANNGQFVSDWTRLNVHTEPEFFEAFTGLDANGNVLPTWATFIPRNGDDPLPITFSFMQQLPDYQRGEAEDEPGRTPTPRLFIQFTPEQRAATRLALRSIEQFANVEFIEVVDSPLTVDPVSGNRGGTLRFGNYYRAAAMNIGGSGADDSDECAHELTPFSFPGPGQISGPEDGDIWFNVEIGFQTFEMDGTITDHPTPCGLAGLDFIDWDGDGNTVGPGSFEYELLLSEIAFAIGQKPPFDAAGPGDQTPILPDETSNNSFTVQGPSSSFDFITGYQLYDVNFFQTVYGTNNNHNVGDDIYSPATLFQGGNNRETLWDAGGIDTLSAVGSTIDDVFIDLRPGTFSSIGNLNNNLSIAFRAQIENAIGSDGNDTLIGNELNNVINGGDGDDTIRGFGGNDTLTGGTGGDTFIFGVADGDNVINEMGLAGRDTLQILPFPGLNDFTQDISFRLDGRDLVVQLTLDGQSTSDTTITIRDQTRGAFRVESLVFGTNFIDLENLTNQATGANQSFQITTESTIFGSLVTPV